VLTALPSRPLTAGLFACLLLVVASGAAVATAADDPAMELTTAAQSDETPTPCEDDGYVPPDLDRDWGPEFVDSLGNDSLADWTGGRIARVGATGDCSLVVVDGETATLTATTVDGTRGVLTGTLDLGSNGSLELVATGEAASGHSREGTTVAGTATVSETSTVASTGTGVGTDTASTGVETADTVSPETDAVDTSSAGTTGTGTMATTTSDRPDSNRTAGLVLSNDGPDFASSVAVASGDQWTRLDLHSGRFFDFAIRRDDGTVRVAIWDASETRDGQWDVRFENATGNADWQVRLRGRAFLDGVAIGVGETRTTPGASEPGTPDETPVQDDPDDEPFPPDDFDPEEVSNDGQDPDGSGSGRAFWGLCLVVIGAVGFRYARGITRFGEQMDAIGSTTRMSEVEAADWNVALTKIGSVVLALVGLGMLVGVVL